MANENRLIDANAFLESIEGIDWYTIRVDGSTTQGAPSEEVAWYKATDIYAAIENAPTVEVVRCKDCRHYRSTNDGGLRYCGYTMMGRCTKTDDFCSYGERKDNV